MKKIIVVGGGISGLAAAHRLTELSRERKLGLSVILLEGSARVGGLLDTRAEEGFLMEGGVDAFLTESPWAVDLCRRVGLEGEIIGTNPSSRRSFILHGRRLFPVPEGFYLVAPVGFQALRRAPALGLLGKARLALEPLIPARHEEADESAAAFIRRRFGRQVLERIGKPMVAGIYTGDLERLSAQAALPRLCELERRYGSVVRGLRAGARAKSAGQGAGPGTSGPRYGLFATLRGGVSRLTEALTARMPEVEVRTGAVVSAVERRGRGWAAALKGGQALEADALLLAAPAYRAAEWTRAAAPELARELAPIEYESAVIVNLGFTEKSAPRLPAGFGFVVSDPQSPVAGCSFSSVKFPGRAPPGGVLLRCFLGGPLHRGIEDAGDRDLLSYAMDPLRKAVEMRGQPEVVRISRHRRAMPQYHVGHHDRVLEIERQLRDIEGLHLTGNGYRGLGIPDCIHQAERAAEEICAGV